MASRVCFHRRRPKQAWQCPRRPTIDTEDIAKQFERDGFAFPIPALSRSQAQAVLDGFDAVTPALANSTHHPWLYKCYLLTTWANDLVRHDHVLDAVEAVLGPDIIVISADLWAKNPHETRHVSWHQDAQYYQIEPMAVLNAWVALTDVTRDNGCMRFSPGSHHQGLVPHDNTFAPDNMLSHGQTLSRPVDEETSVDVLLRQGEISMHHAYLAHSSGPNHTSGRRVAVAIKYMAASSRSAGGPPLSGMLVRGRDHETVRLENPPSEDFGVREIAEHDKAMAPHAATRYMHF